MAVASVEQSDIEHAAAMDNVDEMRSSCLVQRNSVPSTQMRCMITASRRASATIAFLCRGAWRSASPRP